MFDRKAHCQRIGAAGGTVTHQRHGTHHMRAIGKAGAQATIAKHGVSYFLGITKRKGWQGRRSESLRADLAAGRVLAALATAFLLAVSVSTSTAHAQYPAPDPSLAPLLALMAEKHPAPAGCVTVGVWEDGSTIAYCDDGHRDGLDNADTWLTHGPDAGDDWTAYHGPLMPLWLQRASLS